MFWMKMLEANLPRRNRHEEMTAEEFMATLPINQ